MVEKAVHGILSVDYCPVEGVLLKVFYLKDCKLQSTTCMVFDRLVSGVGKRSRFL
jgi:hypothetical protein